MSRPSYGAWVGFIEAHHRFIVAFSVLVCVGCALALTRLRLDIDVLRMLPEGSPAFDDFKSFIADFGELDQLIVLLEGQSAEQLHGFADTFAARIAELETVAAVQARIDVLQIMEGMLGRYVYNYLPEEDYAELSRRLTPEGIAAQVAADRTALSAPFDLGAARMIAEDPLGVRRLAATAFAEAYGRLTPNLRDGYLSTTDGTALLLLVRPRASGFDIAFSERLMHQVRLAEADTRRSTPGEGVRVAYTGSYVYALEDAATLRWDIARYTVFALIGVLAVFYVSYRNLRILPFVTYPLVVTTLLTFALSLLLFDQLNAVSISFAAILYGLSIDGGIYFYTRLLEERQRQDLRGAVAATLAGMGRANLAASATTAAAFAAIGLSCLGAVRQLGLLSALGMLLSTVEIFTLYPALGFFLARGDVAGGAALETRRLGRLAEASAERARPIGLLAALLMVAFAFGARQVSLDVGLTHLRPTDSEAVRVQNEIEIRFGQENPAGAVLVRRPNFEQALVDGEQIARQLRVYRDKGLLQSVQSVEAVLPSAATQRARLALYNQMPRALGAAMLRTALARHGFAVDRFQAFFADFLRPREEVVSIDTPAVAPLAFLIHQHVRPVAGGYSVATYITPAGGVSLRAVADRLRNDMTGLPFTVAARSLLEEELGVVLRRELAMFCVLALAGNFLLLLMTFRSVGTAVAILAPVGLVVLMLFTGMWISGIAIDPVNLIVTPLLFGIGVDYGVYIVARARELGSVAAALRHTGKAVSATALTTMTGFGFLGMSRFPALATLGILGSVGLFLCLVLSIVLLPALLMLLSPDRMRKV